MSSTFVTLAEVLEARGGPLGEEEIWSLLLGTAEAMVDLSYKGQTNICTIITPGSLLLSATGTLAFKSCSQSEETSPFTAPEMLQGRPMSTKLAVEKVAVYSLGMTLYWCVDYRLPQNQPVQLSDALNMLLLSMCEDVAHRRMGLSAILEACEEQQKAMPLPPPNRAIRQLVEHLLNNTAESSAISNPVVPLSGRSQMVRERLHGKRSAYLGNPEGNGASGQRRRLSSDSELHKGGLSQQKSWTQKRRSSPPPSFQTTPNRLLSGLQQRGSGSSSWLSRSPYLSEGGRPPSPPISLSESSASLAQRKAKTLGPEFARMGDEPQITLELPGSIVSKKGKSCVSQREVCVFLPSDQCLLVRCDIKSRGRDVFDMVVAHANLVEHFYFGLAFIDDDDYFFLDPEMKISKVAPDVWKKQPGAAFTLYLRVKFFADDVSFIQHRLTRHQYYLQLRKDLLEDKLHCNEDTALYLAALALQAEFGDYMPEVYGRTYFQLEQYVSKRILDKMALPCLREELPRLHSNNSHMLPEEAEMEFLKLTQQLSEYGVLFHRVGREHDKRPIGGDMMLGISSKGISVYELRNNTRFMSRRFHWNETDNISAGRRKFTIECSPSGKKHSFQTESSKIAQYLLSLCSAQHKFDSEMASRQLTHTLTTDENLEKYLAVCRSQHSQMKRLSCSEMVLNNVGLTAALPSDSFSKSCDDLSSKAEARQKKQRELQDINEMREPLHSSSTPEPIYRNMSIVSLNRPDSEPIYRNMSIVSLNRPDSEPIYRNMSIVSLHRQDSEVQSGSSSLRGTPTRSPPEREIICVSLKKDPKLGYGFVIVGEDSTGKLDLGIFIGSIIPDGPADKDGRIRAGGRLISLNKSSLEGVSFSAAAAILQTCPEEVELIVSQPKQSLHDSKMAGGAGGYSLMLERSYDSQTTLSSEYRPAVEELEEALTTILTPKAGRRLPVPVVRILETQDNWSRNSSITSMRAPDILFVELRKNNGSLGISVAGGVNTSVRNGGIYIKSLVMEGAADLDGRIQIGDRLLEVDGTNLRGVTHRQAVECLKGTGEVVSLLLEREQPVVLDTSTPSTLERQMCSSLSSSFSTLPGRDVPMDTTFSSRPKDYSFVSDENTADVLLRRSVNGLGFSFIVWDMSAPLGFGGACVGGSVVRIKRLFPGQPAEQSGQLQEGDVILAVNGQSLKGIPYQKVLLMLRGASDEVRLTICRPPPGTLPDIDTCSLSAGLSPLRGTRSMSLDLRMRDLSMDFHRLLQLKAEEQRKEKDELLERLKRLEEREQREEREREEREQREEREREQREGREREGREKAERERMEKREEQREQRVQKQREEMQRLEEEEEEQHEQEEADEDDSPPSTASVATSSSGSEPSDTPTRGLRPCDTPTRGLRPWDNTGTPIRGLRPCDTSDTPTRGLRPCDTSDPPTRGLRPCDTSDTPIRGLGPCDISDTPIRGLGPCDTSDTPTRGLRPCDTSDTPIRGLGPCDISDTPIRGLGPCDISDTPIRGLGPCDTSDTPTRGLRPCDTSDTPIRGVGSCDTPISKGPSIGSPAREAGSSDRPMRVVTPKGTPMRQVEPMNESTAEPAAASVTMATDSAMSQEPTVRSSIQSQEESTMFPSGLSQQVNGSTFCMVSNGLAFLADEEYLTISSLTDSTTDPSHTHTHTHPSPSHTHTHTHPSPSPSHRHTHTHPSPSPPHTHTQTHPSPSPTHTHTQTHPSPSPTHTHTQTQPSPSPTHTHTQTQPSQSTHTYSHTQPAHTHSDTQSTHTPAPTQPSQTHAHTQPCYTHSHSQPTHTQIHMQPSHTHTHTQPLHSPALHTHTPTLPTLPSHTHTPAPLTHSHTPTLPSHTHTPVSPAQTHTPASPSHTPIPPAHTHTPASPSHTPVPPAHTHTPGPSPAELPPPQAPGRKLGWLEEEEDEDEEDPHREVLKEFELTVTLSKSWSGSFGFTIMRSKLDGCYYVQEVLDNPARSDGRLRGGDRLIIVNGHYVTTVTDDMAMSILRSSSRKLVMVLGRAVQNLVAPPSADSLPDIILHKTITGQLGIKLTGGIGSHWQGIYVLEVVPLSPASEEGTLQPRDKILYICGRCTLGMTLEDAVKACENATRKVKLKALREDQPVTPRAKWNGLFDWKKEKRFFPRFEEPNLPEPEYFPEEERPERHDSPVRFRPKHSIPSQQESCIIQVEFTKPEGSGLGFALMGGANGSALRVKEICSGGVAQLDGRLRVGDILLEVNDVIVSGLSHSKVVDILRQAEGVVQLVVCRDYLSMAPPTEQFHAPPTDTEETPVVGKKEDPPAIPLNIPPDNIRRASVHSEDSSSIPPVQRCCPSMRVGDLLQDSPTRNCPSPPYHPSSPPRNSPSSPHHSPSLKEQPSAWSSEEEEEESAQPSSLNILPPTGRPIVSEEELSTLAIISTSKTGCYSGSRVRTLIQILQHQDQQEIIKEFMALEHLKPSDNCLVGKAPENRHKNRYRDILPYDKTRVLLGDQHEYINASYIRMQVGLEEFFYISCQAPLPSTVDAFWQMIWENRSDVIAMVTQEVERGRVKCHKYWPDSLDVPMETDRYKLILDNYQQLDFFHINIIKMVEKKSGSCHFVKQLCVLCWPDHGPPGSSEQLVRFLSYMRAVHSRGPITVHCSAGIGRTGVLICTDVIINLIQNDLNISVSDIVKEMRMQRYGMIQTKEQYLFCYKVWLEVLQGVLQLHGNQWQPEASV